MVKLSPKLSGQASHRPGREYNVSGTLTATYTYDPFGTPEGTSTPTDYGFTGEPQDAATGLVQLRARWYQPGSGAFTSRDSFHGLSEQPQSLAPYAYAYNDPINGADPTGLWRWQHTSGTQPYHELIEDAYLALRDPRAAHAEYNELGRIYRERMRQFRAPLAPVGDEKVDLLNSATGDVYEIEPIDNVREGFTQAARYTGALRNAGIDSYIYGVRPNLQGSRFGGYNWNRVDWRLGLPFNFAPIVAPVVIGTKPANMVKAPATYDFLDYGELVAMSPAEGVVVYWLQPKVGVEWQEFLTRVPNVRLAMPRGWHYGDQRPPLNRPAPPANPAPPPGPPPAPKPYQPPLFPWPNLPSLGGGYGAGLCNPPGPTGLPGQPY